MSKHDSDPFEGTVYGKYRDEYREHSPGLVDVVPGTTIRIETSAGEPQREPVRYVIVSG